MSVMAVADGLARPALAQCHPHLMTRRGFGGRAPSCERKAGAGCGLGGEVGRGGGDSGVPPLSPKTRIAGGGEASSCSLSLVPHFPSSWMGEG